MVNEYGDIMNSKTRRILKPSLKQNGYLRVVISEGNVTKNYYVHRLVAIYFLDNAENKPCVNHIDGIKTNNHVSNLEWVSYNENLNHAYRIGLIKTSENVIENAKKAARKPIVVYDMNMNRIGEFESIVFASHFSGMSRQIIDRVLKCEQHNAKGFIFKYKE